MWKKNFSTRDDRYIKAGFTSQQSNRSKYQNVICAKQSSKLLRWVKQSQRLYCSSTCDVSRTTSQRGKFLDFLLPRRKFSILRWAAITVRLEESSECIRNDQQIINRQKLEKAKSTNFRKESSLISPQINTEASSSQPEGSTTFSLISCSSLEDTQTPRRI